MKMKIGVGYAVKEKVRHMEDNPSEGITRIMKKEVVGCVQYVVGKKEFLVQFEDGQKKDISYFSLTYVCS